MSQDGGPLVSRSAANACALISGRVGIAFESFLNLKRQTLHPASHVGVPRRNPDPDAGRDGNHDCAITWRTRISAAVSTSAHTITRSPLASTISICPVDP